MFEYFIWKVFRIGTVRYNWPMSAHASQAFSIADCTDSEDLPFILCCLEPGVFIDRNTFILIIGNTLRTSYLYCIVVQSLTGSKVVEISEDRKQMRTRNEPGKWSLSGVEPKTFSSLDASVPEFVPGQVFRAAAAAQSDDAGMELCQSCDEGSKDLPAVDAASEVSSRLEEMSVSTAAAAEPADSEDISDVAADTDMQPDTLADVADDQDAAIERLNTTSNDEQYGKNTQRTDVLYLIHFFHNNNDNDTYIAQMQQMR